MKKITRRRFIQQTALATAGLWHGGAFVGPDRAYAAETNPPYPVLVAAKNGEPEQLFDKAIAAAGGMVRFVKKGDTVLVKPNIGWARDPETGANTNPLLVKRIVEHALQAGAKKVYVCDNTVSWGWRAYRSSGIKAAAEKAGAAVVPANKESYYQTVIIPGARTLQEVKVHELYLQADSVINVPVLKHHGSAQLTIAMKNLMGVVWDRSWYHLHDLHQCIADFCLYRKVQLNVIDAYRVTLRNGPSSARAEDVMLKKSLILSADIVAADAAAAKLMGHDPQSISYLSLAAQQGTGTMALDKLSIARLVL